jgi:hypothetical protein
MNGSRSLATTLDEQLESTLRQIERRLRTASLYLGPDLSKADIKAAQRTMHDAERTLGELEGDPWGPSVVLQARSILSSHLLAADACEEADTGTNVTARVLRRGADSARRVIARHSFAEVVDASR